MFAATIDKVPGDDGDPADTVETPPTAPGTVFPRAMHPQVSSNTTKGAGR